jgi:hypothetical protein
MLRSLFILMLVGLMAAVGVYYENQAGESLATLETGTDSTLVAATAVRKVSEPERTSDINCESLDCQENGAESQRTHDMHKSVMDEETIKPLQN